MSKYVWIISRPGNVAGWEIWIGPVGFCITKYPRIDWNWGWWKVKNGGGRHLSKGKREF